MDNLERKIEKGSLYKLDKNLLLTKVDKNYRITNGPAFIDELNKQLNTEVKTGEFGAEMQVELINDGPVTILIDSKNRE